MGGTLLATGRVRHRRHQPVGHGFSYPVGWILLDPLSAPTLLERGWWSSWRGPGFARFHRADFLTGAVDLAEAARERVRQRTGHRPAGPVQFLTTLRTAGMCFNPVSFAFCHDVTAGPVTAIVAEITNTPWGERHAYVLGPKGADAENTGTPSHHEYRFAKRFHVSPFHGMAQDYVWRFAFLPRRLAISMHNLEGGVRVFDADLTLTLRAATPARWFRHLLAWPVNTARALVAIHWEAARLFLKRVPVHDHPRAMSPPCT